MITYKEIKNQLFIQKLPIYCNSVMEVRAIIFFYFHILGSNGFKIKKMLFMVTQINY